jgi:hypothetical protein
MDLFLGVDKGSGSHSVCCTRSFHMAVFAPPAGSGDLTLSVDTTNWRLVLPGCDSSLPTLVEIRAQ